MESNQYCAFISYRHLMPDMVIAKRLHTAIETYHIPAAIQKRTSRKRMGRVFRDAEELPLSSDLGADIEEALDNSEWFIAICSPEYLKSKWCMRELELFVERHGIDHVLVVLVSGEPEESFPEILCNGKNSIGERVKIEPLAADVRDSSLSKSMGRLNQEKLRLIAPMLSVSYDDLKRRARQRRIRIALSITFAAIAVFLAITAFMIVSNKRAEALRQEAEEQRIQAEIERKAAANNNISELIEKANYLFSKDERKEAASLLLKANGISEANDGIRHDEIIDLLRHVMFVAPFTPVSTLVDQNLQISDFIVSNDEHYAVGIENGNTIVLVDLASNNLKYRIVMDTVELNHIEFSPNGERFLAICGTGRYVQTWNTEDGSRAFSYYSETGTSMRIGNAHFWKDADSLLVQDWDTIYTVSSDGSKNRFYKIGDQQQGYSYTSNIYTSVISNGASVKSFFNTTRTDYMEIDMVLSNDMSKVLISGMLGETGTIILNDRGDRICLLQGMPATFAETYSFSPDDRQVSCLSVFDFIASWDASSGELRYIHTAIGGELSLGKIKSRIAYSPDGNQFSFVYNNSLAIWNADGSAYLSEVNLKGEHHYNPIVSYSKDGNYIFVSYEDMYFMAKDGYSLMIMTGNASMPYTKCVPLQDSVLVSQIGAETRFYSLPKISSVQSVNSYNGELRDKFDFTKSQEIWDTFPKGEHQLSEASLIALSQNGYENTPSLFFSEDSKTAAITYPDGTIELFKREGQGKIDAVFKPFPSWTTWNTSLAMNDRYLVVSGGAPQLIIYDLQSNTIAKNPRVDHYYEKFAFNQRGDKLMALGVGGYGLSVYDIESGQMLFNMGPNEKVISFAFSSDGAYAVGKTERGFLIGDMLINETDLLARAWRLVAGHE